METMGVQPMHQQLIDEATKILGPKAKKTLHTHIEPTDNNGFIVHHETHVDGHPTDGKRPKHVFTSKKAMLKHISDNYPDEMEGSRSEEAKETAAKAADEIKNKQES